MILVVEFSVGWFWVVGRFVKEVVNVVDNGYLESSLV